ncbi:ribosomal protein L6 [Segatella baroniae F0067]|uniref:Large ribosomal subunit protein uL6 n=2 Tax=Segatella baroniae TaxID=305719 RepID=U2QLG0_9BACT|nr:ribosomal protein L6 [Segatella baroniae F0067]
MLHLLIGGLNMSRIGKMPIEVPAGVTVNFDKNTNVVSVKGPKGELSQWIDPSIKFSNADGHLTFEVDEDSPVNIKQKQAFHGLYRSLVNNMVVGVSEGYKKTLELVGVGYRVSNQGNLVEFSLGYTHPIFIQLPNEVKVETKSERNQNPIISLESCDKALLGLICAKIRSFRKPEPYKGKGVLFKGEVIRRKSGKTAAAK